ncbi:hypothetical protein [Sinorhizobium psoraleae]|uniref:Uncharacterized protein n=1 Tax=Sinorhizobium psoraleae TaxID=520838 RepID=A0ABT4KCF1_9HYPH|nr:hypothetical protein [Sinorhizobium psoraleae]MCZ4088647.1 hypothetical protein [Sinorhizobium psoraleae]
MKARTTMWRRTARSSPYLTIECVAVDGRVLRLVEANTDEVLTDGVASGLP